jgi:hypothetical protein
MRSLPISLVVVIVLLPVVALLAIGAAGAEVVVGRPHSSVVKLTSENYDEYVTGDDANGLWFLKFYAPW